MNRHTIIVIGASAGGVEALIQIVRDLPEDFAASIFVVLHIPAENKSLLADILAKNSSLKVVQAVDAMSIEQSTIYVAPPDHHMLLEKDTIRVVRGPKENHHRPAIDPLFRSAALVYGPQVIGVVLTGSLDDGTAGLAAIKSRGGIAVVQDPATALYSSMPESALAYVKIDYCVPLEHIAPLLVRLSDLPAGDSMNFPISPDLEKEVQIAKMDKYTLSEEKHAGQPSVFSCPECGGVLWELHDKNLLRFRCRVGHAFSAESIQAAQVEALEEALWTALKTLQESANLSRRMGRQAHQKGQQWLAKTFEERFQQAEKRANIIRSVLLSDSLPPTSPLEENTPVDEEFSDRHVQED